LTAFVLLILGYASIAVTDPWTARWDARMSAGFAKRKPLKFFLGACD
jgi:hypothetical protein